MYPSTSSFRTGLCAAAALHVANEAASWGFFSKPGAVIRKPPLARGSGLWARLRNLAKNLGSVISKRIVFPLSVELIFASDNFAPRSIHPAQPGCCQEVRMGSPLPSMMMSLSLMLSQVTVPAPQRPLLTW